MQHEEKVRLWLGLCEDGCSRSDSEGRDEDTAISASTATEEEQEGMPSEPYLTAKAAAGSLATLANDSTFADLLVKEECARTLVALLQSTDGNLIHRALVIIVELLSSKEEMSERYIVARHLMEGSIVPAMTAVGKSGSYQHLGSLISDAVQALSDAMNSSSEDF